MKVAGFGFREAAPLAALREALAAAGGADGVVMVATIARKATAPALLALAKELGAKVYAAPAERLAGAQTLTRSARTTARFGVGSLAEAAALVAAGDGARLLGPRTASADGMAMAAIAVSADEAAAGE